MTLKTIERVIKTVEVTEGAGVKVHRSIGIPTLRNFDPFLMLDYFGSDDPKEYIAGFPSHPHRGFNTFSYILEGNMSHQDSMGNKGNLSAGSAQWMKAASGVIHSEIPTQTEGSMRGFQLWINLPASEKMTEPNYQEFSPEVFPIVKSENQKVKVLMGRYQNETGPIKDPITDVQYLDVGLNSNAHFEHRISTEMVSFIFLFEGDAKVAGTDIEKHHFAILGEGDQISIAAGLNGARFILVAGKPIGEPIVQRGPFVMNTEQEIIQAMSDYRDGSLVMHKADMITA